MITKKELAIAYGIHENTFARRIAEFGIKGRRLITPLQLRKIINELGYPPHSTKGVENILKNPCQLELEI